MLVPIILCCSSNGSHPQQHKFCPLVDHASFKRAAGCNHRIQKRNSRSLRDGRNPKIRIFAKSCCFCCSSTNTKSDQSCLSHPVQVLVLYSFFLRKANCSNPFKKTIMSAKEEEPQNASQDFRYSFDEDDLKKFKEEAPWYVLSFCFSRCYFFLNSLCWWTSFLTYIQ